MKMKKILAATLAGIMALNLAACGAASRASTDDTAGDAA